MKVLIDGIIHDAEHKPIFLIFDDPLELKNHLKNMDQMVVNPPPTGEPPTYSVYPDNISGEEILDIYNNQIKHLNEGS